MMAACEAWLDRGVPVLLFPEGTRSPDGVMRPFKDGAFQLATKKQCPVIPIVLTGTASLLPKHGFVLDTRADCVVEVLEPVHPAAFEGDAGALRDHVRALIDARRAAMRVESTPEPAYS